MLRASPLSVVLLLFAALNCRAQSAGSDTSSSQSSSPAAGTPSTQTQTPNKEKDKNAKKPKKVWTNEEVSGLNGPVSVVGDANAPTQAARRGTSADPGNSAIARLKEELQKLHAQLEQTDKQINDLKKVSSGETNGSGGVQLHHGYNMVPIPDQLKQLEEKKKQIQARIDALEDDARKHGIEPGQLR